MLVTTAITGESSRKVPSLSSASATSSSPWPRRALVPMACTLPPMTVVGSMPALPRIAAISEVVVVLPCVPATAMPYFRRISSASISARGITGILSARACTTSGLEYFTAEEMTTTSMPGVHRVGAVAVADRRAARDQPAGRIALARGPTR